VADAVQIEVTDAYKDWYLDLQKKDAAAVDRKVKRLQMTGVTLPFPRSSDIKGSKYPIRAAPSSQVGHKDVLVKMDFRLI
jgi:hypothetical protein